MDHYWMLISWYNIRPPLVIIALHLLFNFYNFSKEHPYFRIRSNCQGVCLFQRGTPILDYWLCAPCNLWNLWILENFRHRICSCLPRLNQYFWSITELFHSSILLAMYLKNFFHLSGDMFVKNVKCFNGYFLK